MVEILLALEGSTPVLSLALAEREGGCLAHLRFDEGESHSRLLPGLIDDLLAQAGLRPEALGGVAVGIGPGAFTGLRVILATAKGIAYARRIPLYGVSTLAALALAARASAPSDAVLVPLLDARKKQVYAGFFRISGRGVEALAPEAALPPEAVAQRLEAFCGPVVLLGEGYRVYRDVLDATVGARRLDLDALPRFPDAREVAALASSSPRFVGPEIFFLEPAYLRSSDAELGWTRPGKRVS